MSSEMANGAGGSPGGAHRVLVAAMAGFVLLEALLLVAAVILPGLADLPAHSLAWLLQGVSLLLAVALSALLLWWWLPRLRQAGAAHQQASAGLQRIFDGLGDGLFVLDEACCLDARISPATAPLLGRPLVAGDNFRQILADWLSPEDQETAVLYVRLLLAGRTREKLMRSLNPLDEVEIATPRGPRHVRFDFRRLREDGVLRLLVQVRDVSEAVRLRRALDAARDRADAQWDAMLRMVQVQPAALMAFIDDAAVGLVEINDRLKSASGRIGEYRAMVNHMFRVAHGMKSSATALGLDFVAGQAAAFEEQLDLLRGQDSYGGEALAAVAESIQQLFGHLDWLRRVARRYAGQPAEAAAPAPVDFPASMAELARRVAQDMSKQVQPKLRLETLEKLPREAAGPLRVITAQLVRNAIAHGIEGPAEREGAGKPGTGQLLVELSANESGQHVLRVVDDGRGLCPQRLRGILRETGRRNEEELAALSDQQVIMEIFKRGFTTAEEVSQHAGRGVGLDVVSEAVRRIGGKVRLRSEPGRYTEFRVEFAA